MFSTEAGELNLCLPHAQAGDGIFVAPAGIVVLFLLLRQQLQSGTLETTLQMIGPCDLNGWMQGKAVNENMT